jgi:hypothetical protein
VAGELVVGPGLVQYGDLLLGRCRAEGVETPYRWSNLSGWDESPAVDSGTVLRPTSHGGWPGPHYAQTRIITLDEIRVRTAPGGIGPAVAAFEAGLPIGRDEEVPLTVQLDSRGPRTAYARVLRRFLPATRTRGLGQEAGGIVQWEASDPRLYDPADPVVGTGLPSPPAGYAYNITYPIDYGTAGSTGSAAFSNLGNADSHPVLTITGDCELPAVTHVGSGRVLEFDVELAVGDTLVVDCWAGSVLLNGLSSRLSTLTARSSLLRAFVLAPGTNELSFRAASGSAATMTASRLSAWM